MKVLNLPIPFFVPISLSTHFLSYIFYNEPNIPNMHSHSHYLTQESNKDPLGPPSLESCEESHLSFPLICCLQDVCGWIISTFREGNGNPLQYSCLANPMDRGSWWAAVHGVTKSRTRLSDFTFTFHFHALEKEMATHSSVLAWKIPGTGEPGGLPSKESHRVGHDWSDLAAAAFLLLKISFINFPLHSSCYIPVILNSSPWLEYILVFLVSGAIAVTTPSGQNSSPASACQEDPINPLRAGTKVSFTVESYLPLVLPPIFPEFLVVLVEFCTVYITSIILITSFNMEFRSLVPQNRDAVNFQFLV